MKGLLHSAFIRSTLTLMSGSLCTQLLAICFSPIITRLYSEEMIGQYTLILTAVSMFGAVICLRYDASIVPENDNNTVFALIKLSALITFVMSLLVAGGYALYNWAQNRISMSPLELFVWVFVLLVLTGVGQILIAFNNRSKEYRLMTSVGVIRETARDISLTLLGIIKVGTIGLLISQVLSVCLGLHRQSKSLRMMDVKWRNISASEMICAGRKHIKQPIYSVPASFANNFSYSVLNIFITNLYGLSTLAYYSMSFRMLGLPLSLVSANMSRVFTEKASREYEQNGNFRRSFLTTTLLLSAFAIPMVIVLELAAPTLFGLFFGAGWEEAGRYVQILAPMFGIRLVVTALTPCMIVLRKQSVDCVLQVLFLVTSFTAYFLCISGQNVYFFLHIISAVYSAIYLIYYVVMFRLSKGSI